MSLKFETIYNIFRQEMNFKILSAKWQPFSFDLNMVMWCCMQHGNDKDGDKVTRTTLDGCEWRDALLYKIQHDKLQQTQQYISVQGSCFKPHKSKSKHWHNQRILRLLLIFVGQHPGKGGKGLLLARISHVGRAPKCRKFGLYATIMKCI